MVVVVGTSMQVFMWWLWRRWQWSLMVVVVVSRFVVSAAVVVLSEQPQSWSCGALEENEGKEEEQKEGEENKN